METEQRRHRAKGFLFGEAHFLRHAGHYRRLEEGTSQRVWLTADSDLRPLDQRIVDVALHFFHRVLVDQRALSGPFLAAVADFQLLDRRHQLVHQTVIDAVLHVDAVGADAGLAAVAEF
ncbi:hypothetical protein D3C78_1418270 [compost metagenome]